MLETAENISVSRLFLDVLTSCHWAANGVLPALQLTAALYFLPRDMRLLIERQFRTLAADNLWRLTPHPFEATSVKPMLIGLCRCLSMFGQLALFLLRPRPGWTWSRDKRKAPMCQHKSMVLSFLSSMWHTIDLYGQMGARRDDR